MSESSYKKQSDNWHWQDFYLVRYLLLTLVGSFIVLWLSADKDSSIPDLFLILDRSSEKSISFAETSLALLGIGFVFCYISSFPVLVFHAIRNSFDKLLSTIIFYCVSLTGICFLAYSQIPDTKTVFAVVFLFSFFQFLLIIYTFDWQFPYLRELSDKRHREPSDIVDSYKHLREHGNAALIIICEFFLAALCRPIFFNANHVSLGLENFRQLGLLIGIWSLPAACIYFFGHHLEYQFVNEKPKYLRPFQRKQRRLFRVFQTFITLRNRKSH